VLVSEEAGEAHLVKNGKITTNLSENELRESLSALLDLSRGDGNLPRRIRALLQPSGSDRRGAREVAEVGDSGGTEEEEN
jgi:hypothetical protein